MLMPLQMALLTWCGFKLVATQKHLCFAWDLRPCKYSVAYTLPILLVLTCSLTILTLAALS